MSLLKNIFNSYKENTQRLIEWQNLIIDKPSPKLRVTEEQLKSASPAIFLRHLEITNDSAQLMDTTVNPEVFFSRYDLYVQECEYLVKLSKFVALDYTDIPQKLQHAKEHYDDIVIEFIERLWSDTYIKAAKLKTEKGKQNRFSKFYDTLKQYDYRMSERCKEFYLSLTPEKPPMARITEAPQKRDEYNKWLDFLSKGGTTEEWETMKKRK